MVGIFLHTTHTYLYLAIYVLHLIACITYPAFLSLHPYSNNILCSDRYGAIHRR